MAPIRRLAPAVLGIAFSAHAVAQVFGTAPSADVLLTTEFRTPLTYQAALARLDDYYQEQVGKKLAIAFPEIAPRRHYEVWHDIWVAFEPAGDQTVIRMKRPADGITSRLVKSWMLAFAGRLDGEIPLTYKELPPLRAAAGDILGTPRDVASIVKNQAALKPLPSWQHAGLIVADSPMLSVVMDPAGPHGSHHVTVTGETEAAARQLITLLIRGAQKPCICAVYSESVELETEIQKEAANRSNAIGPNPNTAIYSAVLTLKNYEDRVRAEPEMQKRIAQAADYYNVKYRIDKAYRQVTLSWTELQGYARETGKFTGEHAAGRTQIPAPRAASQSGAYLTARTKLESLQPGAYRVRLEGEAGAGQPALIDERIYWFDGKTFEEL